MRSPYFGNKLAVIAVSIPTYLPGGWVKGTADDANGSKLRTFHFGFLAYLLPHDLE